MLKTNFSFTLSIMLAFMLLAGLVLSISPAPVNAASFANGVDIGWLSQLESRGVTWNNDSGTQQDALQIMKDHGINSVRLRVFVNPPSTFIWQKNSSTTCLLGFTDKAGVLAAAQRAKNLGLRIMIDFHYSDHFADPAIQDKPTAWSSHSFSQLVTDVYNHTYDVLNTLKSNGIAVEWAQVGNEITGGMMWPEGSTSNWRQLSQLLLCGYNAVKAVDSSTKVIIHLDNALNNSWYRTFFDNIKNNGAKWDVIAMSYYPAWNGNNISTIQTNLNDMASRYGSEVLLAEVGWSNTDPTGAYNYLLQCLNAVKAVPNSKGTGVFWWEPESVPDVLTDGYSLGACSLVSTNKLKFTTAIDAYLGTTRTPTPTTVPTPTPIQGGRTNIAVNKTASADSEETAKGNTAAKGNDGTTTTRWCANNGNNGHWWKVDLGSRQNITGSEVMWEMSGQVYKYKVEVSTDNVT